MSDTKNAFDVYNISLRVKDDVLKPSKITEEAILEKAVKNNDSVRLENLPDILNPEMLDLEKVKAWFELISNQSDDFYKKLENRTLYLNNPQFLLSSSSPTNTDSYNAKVRFSFEYDQSKLSMPAVSFGESLFVSDEILDIAEAFFRQKQDAITSLENEVVEAEKSENHKKLNQLYQQLVYEKYARFSAVKAWKANLEAKQALGDLNDTLQATLEKVSRFFNEYMVPPIR